MRNKWWVPVAILATIIPLGMFISVLYPPDATLGIILIPITLLGGVLLLFSPIAVYFDRKYIAKVSDWEPSDWYYWMFVPPLSLVLPYVYLYNRHKYVDTP